jgi:hypothetical protein
MPAASVLHDRALNGRGNQGGDKEHDIQDRHALVLLVARPSCTVAKGFPARIGRIAAAPCPAWSEERGCFVRKRRWNLDARCARGHRRGRQPERGSPLPRTRNTRPLACRAESSCARSCVEQGNFHVGAERRFVERQRYVAHEDIRLDRGTTDQVSRARGRANRPPGRRAGRGSLRRARAGCFRPASRRNARP